MGPCCSLVHAADMSGQVIGHVRVPGHLKNSRTDRLSKDNHVRPLQIGRGVRESVRETDTFIKATTDPLTAACWVELCCIAEKAEHCTSREEFNECLDAWERCNQRYRTLRDMVEGASGVAAESGQDNGAKSQPAPGAPSTLVEG